jgi:hypothetical protein
VSRNASNLIFLLIFITLIGLAQARVSALFDIVGEYKLEKEKLDLDEIFANEKRFRIRLLNGFPFSYSSCFIERWMSCSRFILSTKRAIIVIERFKRNITSLPLPLVQLPAAPFHLLLVVTVILILIITSTSTTPVVQFP